MKNKNIVVTLAFSEEEYSQLREKSKAEGLKPTTYSKSVVIKSINLT
jgi:hypothetical protein